MSSDMADNEEHLRLLSIFHYIVGGLIGLFACFPMIHIVMGILMVSGAPSANDSSDARFTELMGGVFIVMGTLFVIVGWIIGYCVVMAGRFLARRTRYTYCLVIAAIECIFMPFGTVLGVFTLIVLTKSAVKEMFEAASYAH